MQASNVPNNANYIYITKNHIQIKCNFHMFTFVLVLNVMINDTSYCLKHYENITAKVAGTNKELHKQQKKTYFFTNKST